MKRTKYIRRWLSTKPHTEIEVLNLIHNWVKGIMLIKTYAKSFRLQNVPTSGGKKPDNWFPRKFL